MNYHNIINMLGFNQEGLIMKILFLILMIISSQAVGDITIHLASKHFGTNTEFNEINPGLGYSHNGWIIGAYKEACLKSLYS